MKFIKVLIDNVLSGPSTDPFPFGDTFTPENLRGRVSFDPSRCTTCRACEQVCAANAIRFDTTPDGKRFLLWHDSCMFCGLCAFYCQQGALTMTNDWHLAHPQADKYAMVEHGVVPNAECASCGAKYVAIAPTAKLFARHAATEDEIEGLRQYCPRCRRKQATELIAAKSEKGQPS